jgi:hypothetical protein
MSNDEIDKIDKIDEIDEIKKAAVSLATFLETVDTKNITSQQLVDQVYRDLKLVSHFNSRLTTLKKIINVLYKIMQGENILTALNDSFHAPFFFRKAGSYNGGGFRDTG